MFALAMAFALGATPAVAVTNGNITCDGKAITTGGQDSEPVLSPDGHTVAFIRATGPAADSYSAPPSELWTGDCTTGQTRKVFVGKAADTPERNLASVYSPAFSLDGGFVYVMSQAWVTSDAIHQIRLSDGREKFVTDGNSLSVIRNGPYRGYLLTQKHMYRKGGEGGSYDPTWVVRPDGKRIKMVPGTDNEGETDLTAEWLKRKGWTAW